MGKYSNLKSELTGFSNDPSYQERIDNEKEKVRSEIEETDRPLTITNFGMTLVEAKLEKKRLEELVKEQNLRIEALNQLLVDRLEAEDYGTFKLNNGVSFSIKDDVYCGVTDKVSFHNWIRENDLEDLFSVHYQTMASMTKERLIKGEEVPPGITPYFKQSITVRGIKGLGEENGN